jgi:dTDP-4-amino-4,6-dideoxygalactose transaminase
METDRIYLSLAHMGGQEQTFIQQSFDTNWITTVGQNLDVFEKDLETYLGNSCHALALNSGTAAIPSRFGFTGNRTRR